MDILLKLLVFALMLGGLIVCHELGHFLAAVALGVRVKEFGLGEDLMDVLNSPGFKPREF